MRAYYSASLADFLNHSDDKISGQLANNDPNMELLRLQRNAWKEQIRILKKDIEALKDYQPVQIAFEYGIPRMGKRVDLILFIEGVIFVVEFKIGEREYNRGAIDQVVGYALDLKDFHKLSHRLDIVPVLIATKADSYKNEIRKYDAKDNVYFPLRCNEKNYLDYIKEVMKQANKYDISPTEWVESPYHPTPNIIEAAQALYAKHSVDEISRTDATAQNLKLTADTVNEIIEKSEKTNTKSICFITGIPGAGKTLAGLNIATKNYCEHNGKHAIFLSGNLPLVQVLQEALARDSVLRAKEKGIKITKEVALREAKTFIQSLHLFRDEYLAEGQPHETIAIFDEAQRSWTMAKTETFLRKKKDISSFNQSEPEFLISVLDRHKKWAVIICLIGSGQEIHDGEAGIGEWFSAIDKSFSAWKIYVSEELNREEYDRFSFENIETKEGLHLATSIRSYRSEYVSEFINEMLEKGAMQAKVVWDKIEKYPIVITRDINKAKQWINDKTKPSQRSGIVAASSGGRLRPCGVNVKEKIDPKVWFLNNVDDVRSSNFLELVATEFDIQGLELDWVCVAWDADLRRLESEWKYHNFTGADWRNVRDKNRRKYLLNSYRVLLTRARQGMVIFVPEGDINDLTRKPEWYDSIYNYLLSCGIEKLEEF